MQYFDTFLLRKNKDFIHDQGLASGYFSQYPCHKKVTISHLQAKGLSSPASEEGNKVARSGLLNQLITDHPKVSPIWSQSHRELPTHLTRTKMRGRNTFKHLSPTDKVSTTTQFHLIINRL